MFYFYILKSRVDGEFYYGSTNDLKRRLKEHNQGLVRSTKSRKPFDVCYYEAFNTEELARSRESKVKSSRGTRLSLIKRIGV